jgi:hypothetical protein
VHLIDEAAGGRAQERGVETGVRARVVDAMVREDGKRTRSDLGQGI